MKKENPTVMLIENKAGRMTCGLLQQCGYRVIEEEDLGQAVENITDFTGRNRPDLILLDLNQVCQEESWMVHMLRSGGQQSNLPIIGLAESHESATCQTTKAIGCNGLFSRHDGIGQLATMIDDLLSQSA